MVENTDVDTVDESKFRPANGTVSSEINVADDEHPLKQALGDKAHREIEADKSVVGERFAFRYKKAKAFAREYLANAETGCIRRARFELSAHDPEKYNSEWFDKHEVPEILDEAREVVGYYPVIEVHTSPEGTNKPRFKIEDNGIGISVEEFVVMKKLGLSASHNEGGQLGNFGQGVMSVYNVVGRYGELDITTWSRIDDANYQVRFKIDGFNDLNGKRDDYGTTFRIPAYAEDAKDFDGEAAVEEYTEGMYVPVIHHKYDSTGVEESKEEYTYSPLEDLLPDGASYVKYEDDMIEAVASPVIGTDQDPKRFLVTMPIEGCGESSEISCGWKYHLRLKDESGPVYVCTHENEDHRGLVPVEPERYTEELIKDREALHPDLLVPGDLVGYKQDDGTYAVPSGVDDELVASRDDLVVMDRTKEMGGVPVGEAHPGPIEGKTAVVVDGSHEGLEVVSEDEWHEIDSDVSETYISNDELNLVPKRKIGQGNLEYDVALPTPVDDRDRFSEHNGQLPHVVSSRLDGEFEERARELIQRLGNDGFDAWYEMDSSDRGVFTREFQRKFYHGGITSEYVKEGLEDEYGVSITEQTAEKLAILYKKVEHAPRSATRPERTGSRVDKKIKDILNKAGDDGDVYMGATISRDKAELAWEIDENNQVIAVSGADMYSVYNDLFGWIPLKELDLYDVGQYDVSQDVVHRLERESSSSSDSSGGWSGELDAETREIQIRGHKEKYTKSTTPRDVVETFEDGGWISKYNGSAKYLIVFKEPDVGGVGVGRQAALGPIAYTVVPNYVADYFEDQDCDNIYIAEQNNFEPITDEIRAEMCTTELETIDLDPYVDETDDELEITIEPDDVTRSTEQLGDLGPETLAVLPTHDLRGVIEGNDSHSFINETKSIGIVCKSLKNRNILSEEHERLVITDPDTVEDTVLGWGSNKLVTERRDESPTLIRHTDVSSYDVTPTNERWSPSNNTYMQMVLPQDIFDRDTDEWDATGGKLSYMIKKKNRKGQAIVNLLHRLAELTPEDEPILRDI